VQEMGFRAFAIESYWEGAEQADTYVKTCVGRAEDAVSSHINVWQSTEYADMLRWICQWNSAHPDPADQVTVFGFDIQQSWLDGPALVQFLARIGIPQSDAMSQGIRSCEYTTYNPRYPFGQIPAEDNQRCLTALDAIETHLVTNRESIIDRTSRATYDRALLRTIGLRGWQESVFIIAHDFVAGYNARDKAMAYAFHAMRATKAPGAKTVVWAANSHVAQSVLPRGERPIGSYLAEHFGEDYFTLALTAYDSQIDFPGYPCGAARRDAGSVEEQLATWGHAALVARHTSPRPPEITAPMGVDQVRPWRDYDGIIFLQHSPKMQPLLWKPCQ
jgi:erythromycin esterase